MLYLLLFSLLLFFISCSSKIGKLFFNIFISSFIASSKVLMLLRMMVVSLNPCAFSRYWILDYILREKRWFRFLRISVSDGASKEDVYLCFSLSFIGGCYFLTFSPPLLSSWTFVFTGAFLILTLISVCDFSLLFSFEN